VVDGVASFDPVKSDNSEDVVYLPQFVVDELKCIRKQQKKQKLQLGAAWQDNDLICCRLDGNPWNPSTVSKKFTAVLASHYAPHIRFHDLRHSHATILHEYGADMKDISDRLRHSTVQITSDIYTDMTFTRRRQVADVFNQAITGPKKSPRRRRGEA
jgi:integrase